MRVDYSGMKTSELAKQCEVDIGCLDSGNHPSTLPRFDGSSLPDFFGDMQALKLMSSFQAFVRHFGGASEDTEFEYLQTLQDEYHDLVPRHRKDGEDILKYFQRGGRCSEDACTNPGHVQRLDEPPLAPAPLLSIVEIRQAVLTQFDIKLRQARAEQANWSASQHPEGRVFYTNRVTKEKTFDVPAAVKDVDLGELFSRHRDTIETASVPTQLGLVDSELANDNILECDSEEEQLPSSLDEEQLSCDLDDGDESDNVLGFDDESDDALLYTDH